MDKALKGFEAVFIDLWNYLYMFLCKLFNEEVNEDWLVPSIDVNEF